jgi:hypothetical protein
MRANYNTRRTSVVFNPRGGVFGGLRGGYEGEGTGGDAPSGETGGGANEPGTGGNITGTDGGYAAAAFAASQMADEAALVAAAKSLAKTRASTRVAATIASKAGLVALSVVAGPVGTVIGFALQASGAIDRAIESAVNGRQLSYEGDITEAEQALANARGAAGSDATFTIELNTIQANLDAAKKAGIQAAVTTLYQTYAKRNPDPAGMAYWSNAFGPTITADEVLAFQQVLYANEPNLRPAATQTTTQTSNNLALPILATLAGFLIFGG